MSKKTFKILHLSDLHVGCDIGHIKHKLWKNNTPVKNKKDFEKAESLFVDKFSKQINKKSHKPDYIIVTGDFVLNGSKEYEHKKAFNLLKELFIKIEFTDPTKIFFVPGNHDLCRKSSDSNNFSDVMKLHVKYANDFYSTLNIGKTKDFTKMLYKDDAFFTDEKYKNRKQKDIYSNDGISFVPLQSQLNSSQHPPKFIGKRRYSSRKLWNFDRGFISKEQIDEINDVETKINIALVHHNPLPIQREGFRFIDEYNNEPEFSYLSNGPEILDALLRKGINIIFHGHRHQKSIIKYRNDNNIEIAIIGAPSCGHDESNVPYLGYNYVEINSDFCSVEVNVTFEKFRRNGEWDEQPETSNILLKNSMNMPFLNFQEGLNRLFENILDINSIGVTMLHYYTETKWNDYYREILSPLTSHIEMFNDFISLAKHSLKDQEKEEIKEEITISIESGVFSSALVDFFSEAQLISRLHEYKVHGKIETNKFLNHIINLWSDRHKSRAVNYFIENVRTSTQENYKINKCVYFRPNKGRKSVGDQVKNKFEWLVKSIISAKSSGNNFCISWLPFNINGLTGESLIEIKYPSLESKILFGYSNENDDLKTVLFIDNETSYSATEGKIIIENIRSLAQKIINPLSHYVLNCFPLYDGKLHIDTLRFIAEKFVPDIDWIIYENYLIEEFDGLIVNSNRDIKNDLIGLKHWVHGILELEQKRLDEMEKNIIKDIIPWVESDWNLIINSLEDKTT